MQEVPLGQIRPYWRNPRRSDGAAVEAVRRSIEQYGFNQPLVLDKDLVIVVGHTRFRAALQLGWQTVPCIIRDDLPEQKIKAYRIHDNKSGEIAGWDMDLLTQELCELHNDDLQILQTAFDADLDKLLKEAGGGASDFSLPAQKDVQAAQHSIDSRFDGVNRRVEQQQVEIICPHCGQKSWMNRQDLLRDPD